jgi:hypothetical protein
MKYFGFIKEHHNVDEFKKSIKELIKENTKPHKNKDMVLEYLKRGYPCVPLMGCVEDANDLRNENEEFVDETFIAYLGILTDGKWYWPEYVITYIEKYPHFMLDEEFVKHVKINNGKIPKIKNEKLKALEKIYFKEVWNIDY